MEVSRNRSGLAEPATMSLGLAYQWSHDWDLSIKIRESHDNPMIFRIKIGKIPKNRIWKSGCFTRGFFSKKMIGFPTTGTMKHPTASPKAGVLLSRAETDTAVIKARCASPKSRNSNSQFQFWSTTLQWLNDSLVLIEDYMKICIYDIYI